MGYSYYSPFLSFGGCHFGKYPWEVATLENTLGKLPLGKVPLGSCLLGKYPWEVAAWENTLGKLPLGKIPLGSCRLGKGL